MNKLLIFILFLVSCDVITEYKQGEITVTIDHYNRVISTEYHGIVREVDYETFVKINDTTLYVDEGQVILKTFKDKIVQ